jgi:LmbE family N-acetylglucosaminyl deacetylase
VLTLAPELGLKRPLRLLCIGAHSDDLEIGCGASVMKWLSGRRQVEVTWVVLSAAGVRAAEARRSAQALLARAKSRTVALEAFRDTYFPAQYAELKRYFEALRKKCDPDIVLSHRLEDRHQDHRLVAELTWNTWRDHLILEYEIAKYDGDLDRPNAYVPVSKALAQRKVRHLERSFGSQRSRDWFTPDAFLGLMRIRGVEARAASGYAEAFHARKLTLF